MGRKISEKLLPCVFILNMNKSYSAYYEVLNQLVYFNQLKVISETYGLGLELSLVFTDFQAVSRKAYKINYPCVRLKGCYFQYKKAIGR